MKRKVNIKKILYLLFAIIDVFLICFSLVLIYSHLDINRRKNNSYISSYTENSQVSYVVNLKENDYITSENFGNSDSYILKYTKDILFDFFYTYTSSEDILTNAHYEVVALVNGNYKRSATDSDTVYSKKFILDSGDVQSQDNSIAIQKSALIDLEKYNQLLEDLKEDTKISLIGNLSVYLNVVTTDKDGVAIDDYIQDASVSLLSDVYEIVAENKTPVVQNFYSDDLKIDYVYLSILGALCIIFIAVLMVLIKLISKKPMSSGKEEIYKYLKVYDDFIVNTTDVVNEDNYEVIQIEDFKELLTLANNNSTSIFFCYNKNEGIFYIILGEYLYKFSICYR